MRKFAYPLAAVLAFAGCEPTTEPKPAEFIHKAFLVNVNGRNPGESGEYTVIFDKDGNLLKLLEIGHSSGKCFYPANTPNACDSFTHRFPINEWMNDGLSHAKIGSERLSYGIAKAMYDAKNKK